MKTKHTPGTWSRNKLNHSPIIVIEMSDGGPPLPIVSVVHGYDEEEVEANICLLIEAPELLDILEQTRQYVAFAFDKGVLGAEIVGRKLDAIVAKAKGEEYHE